MPHTVSLARHPESRAEAVRGIEVEVEWTGDETLSLNYVLRGDPARLRIPARRPPRRADRLWRHTCFEAFVACDRRAEYYEFNFSPSGAWSLYGFQRYREAMPTVKDVSIPTITARTAQDRFQLGAVIDLSRLPGVQTSAPLRLGLAAVVEAEDGRLAHWAIKHTPGRPDFHHADAFALKIDPAGST